MLVIRSIWGDNIAPSLPRSLAEPCRPTVGREGHRHLVVQLGAQFSQLTEVRSRPCGTAPLPVQAKRGQGNVAGEGRRPVNVNRALPIKLL